MNPAELYRAGHLDEAIEALTTEVKEDPTDVRARTFLFELLCFNGDFDRAERQLGALGMRGKEAEAGTLLYRAVLSGERRRREMFVREKVPPEVGVAPPVGGTLNGQAFASISDADPRIGAHVEAFVGGQYRWIPFAHLESVEIQEPSRLRDLLWIPAIVRALPEHGGADVGEVLLPVLTPLAFDHDDADVRLGRMTDFRALPDGREVPAGQKLWVVDDREVPILEVRSLQVSTPAQA